MPSRTLAMSPVTGVKTPKNRATLLFTCNATGTEKLTPLFIHYFKNPRALKGIDIDKLPVDYRWSKSAWMQVPIFNDYLTKLNKNMHKQNRNILLLMDNATTHKVINPERLSNIKLHYFPPNTTSHLQPCDAGVIRSFKVFVSQFFFPVSAFTYMNFITGSIS